MLPSIKLVEVAANSIHLEAVKRIGHSNAATLGFFPEGAFDEHARRRWIIGCLGQDGAVMGYLLYRISSSKATIVHLCIDSDQRGNGIARALVDHLRALTADFYGIGLKCRRDYEASKMWPKLGFVAVTSVQGRGRAGNELTFWWLDHGHSTLFANSKSADRDSKIRVVMDANVFFDLDDPSRPGFEESNALLADWLSDTIELSVTDEIFNEIERCLDPTKRARSKCQAATYFLARCSTDDFFAVLDSLRPFWGTGGTARDEADQRQLARTIASNVRFFATRDSHLLDLYDDIYERFGVSVVRPADLVIRLDQLKREDEYQPARLAGSLSEIRLVGPDEEEPLTRTFQLSRMGESQSQFQQVLRRLLSKPERFRCEQVTSPEGAALAVICLDLEDPHIMKVPLFRIAHKPDEPTITRHLIFRTVWRSSRQRKTYTEFTDAFVSERVRDALVGDGFVGTIGCVWAKANPALACSAPQLAERLLACRPSPGSDTRYFDELAVALNRPGLAKEPMLCSELERMLWPAKIADAEIPTFIIPIKAKWAHDLFDEGLANQTLFGARSDLALRRERGYYRSDRGGARLNAPGRILWYVCEDARFEGTKHIRACSRLDEVVIGSARQLYRQFRRLGVYTWRDVLDTAGGNPESRIMALRFSNTELFERPVSLEIVRRIFATAGVGLQTRSPCKTPPEIFYHIYTVGNSIPERGGQTAQ